MCCKFQPEFWTLILGDVYMYIYIYIKSPRGKNRRETTCGKFVPSNQELLDRNELAAEDLKRGSELLPPQIMVDEKRVETGVDLIHSAKLLLGSFLRILETENVWAYSIEKHHVGKMNGLTPAFLEIEVMQKK